MFILYSKATIFWRDAYFTIGILCLISIFVKVTFDFLGELSKTAYEPKMTDEQKANFQLYFGFWRHNFQYFEESEERKGGILSGIVYLYVLLLLCIIVKYLKKYDKVFHKQEPEIPEPQDEVAQLEPELVLDDEQHVSFEQSEPSNRQILPEEHQLDIEQAP
jgi:hypothetical protein